MPARFAAAREAGFDRVEVPSPYAMSIPELDHTLRRHDLLLSGIATPMGNAALGECGFMGVPRRIADFRKGFLKAVEYAEALEVEVIHLMAGIAERPRSDKMLKRNLAWAAYTAPGHILTLGPQDPVAWPGYAVDSLSYALDLIDWIGAPNLMLSLNTRAEPNPCATWQRYGPRTAHVQLSGAMGDDTLLRAMTEGGFDGVLSPARAD
ncbi:MAG: TIM barrel protein [Pseudomonadota bacterium]